MREQHCRQTKVDYLNLGLPTSSTRLCCEDVIKLEVSVHYALRVQVSCSTAYLLEHPDSLNLSLLWQLVLPLHDPVYKWLSCNALHNNCELSYLVDHLYELWEAGMLVLRYDSTQLYFLQELLHLRCLHAFF